MIISNLIYKSIFNLVLAFSQWISFPDIWGGIIGLFSPTRLDPIKNRQISSLSTRIGFNLLELLVVIFIICFIFLSFFMQPI